MRALVATAVLLIVGGCLAAPAVAARVVTLQEVERAFYEAGIPFSSDWRPRPPNPYLAPRPSTPDLLLPRAFRPHLIGVAQHVNDRTYKIRSVFVFDAASVAPRFETWFEHHCNCRGSIFRTVRNVVYFGSPSPAVTRALAPLGR